MMPDDSPSFRVDVACVGGGGAGLLAAALAAERGARVACFAPDADGKQTSSPRSVALMRDAIDILAEIDVVPERLSQARPMRGLAILDPRRGDETSFRAEEIELDALAWNVPEDALLNALRRRCLEAEGLSLLSRSAREVHLGAESVSVVDEAGGVVEARVLIAADGRDSLCRSAAGIEVSRSVGGQTALVARVSHSEPHEDVSLEVHLKGGPLALAPLEGKASALTWAASDDEAGRLIDLDESAFASRVSEATAGRLGTIVLEGERRRFPILSLRARLFAARRVFLVGESGHVLPPIGAQGLNLGARDADVASRLIADALARGDDPGSVDVCERYDSLRRPDVLLRSAACGALSSALSSESELPRDLLGAGLLLARRFAPLRRALMREGTSAGSIFGTRFASSPPRESE